MAKKVRLRRKTWLRKTFVMLGYRGDLLNPAQITEMLGVKPRHAEDAMAKGDILISRGREYPHWTGIWRLRTDSIKSNEIDDHLRAVLKILTPHRRAAMKIKNTSGVRSWLVIHWVGANWSDILIIQSKLLARASAFVRSVCLSEEVVKVR